MLRTLIASLTRKPAPSLFVAPPTADRPLLALVPVATERASVKGYSYGRNDLRARAIAARNADRASF